MADIYEEGLICNLWLTCTQSLCHTVQTNEMKNCHSGLSGIFDSFPILGKQMFWRSLSMHVFYLIKLDIQMYSQIR